MARITNKNFPFTPLQLMWITQLRKHPERQAQGVLGYKSNDGRTPYRACCLGELHLCAHRIAKKKLPFSNGEILDGMIGSILKESYGKYGLYSANAIFIYRGKHRLYKIKGKKYTGLAAANDGGATWTEIADFIEKYPTRVFKH